MICEWLLCCFFFFFFKQKTAYEMCGRDWSSDVCSSDLSELKTGRHWSKEDRKRHVQRARQHQHYKKLLQQKLEMMKTSTKDEQSHLLELSHKKYQRHAMRDLNFLTVQEMLAHRMRLPATTSNILSVTTV